MVTAPKLTLLSLVLCAALAPASRADGFGISYTQNTKHGAIAVGYSSGPFWGPGYRAGPYGHRARCWVPGHYETVREKVWVEGCLERVWIDPAYTWRRDAWGRTYPVCVSAGRYEMVKRPGRYELREVQVWVAGCWRS
jgi:hypothetical protein